MQLEQFAENIWIYEGAKIKFYGFPFPTRMTVIRLSDNKLWIHSPEKLNDQLIKELSGLGEVSYLISPNKLHHLFLDEWITAYPKAIKYAAPGLANKRAEIIFDCELSDQSEAVWQEEIDQTVFHGSPAMEEVVFYHRPSKTLILTDLIENLDPGTLNWWQRGLAKIAGILSPNGKMPLDWRVSFSVGDKQIARSSLECMLSWDTERIILSHGKCVVSNGNEFLDRSFRWLTKNA